MFLTSFCGMYTAEASLKLNPMTKILGEVVLPFTVGLGKLIELESRGIFLPNLSLHSDGFDKSTCGVTGSLLKSTVGTSTIALPAFQISFPLLFMHVNFLPLEIDT